MSFDKKSPRHRIPESFRVERLESRVLLSADPVLTPLAAALMPHAMHIAALPHSATAQHLEFAAQMAMFNAEATSLHQSVLYPTQTVAAHAAQGATVTTASHATAATAASTASAFTAAQTATSAASPVASQAAVQAATTSLASQPGRMHILAAPPGGAPTVWGSATQTNPTVGNSLEINFPSNVTVTLATGTTSATATLGGAGDWLFAGTAAQNLTIVRTGTGSSSVTFATMPSLATMGGTGQFALQNLSIGTSAAPVTNVTFTGDVNLTGNLVIYATGTVNFNGAVTITNNDSLTIIGANQVNFTNPVALNGTDGSGGANSTLAQPGNIFIQSNHVTFPAGSSALSGSGTLTLLPTTSGNSILFADPTGVSSSSTTLVIANADIQSWGSTFSSIAIGGSVSGHADGLTSLISIGATQNFGLGGTPTVRDPITFYAGAINLVAAPPATGSAYTFYGNGSITFDAVNNISLNNTVIANSSGSVAQNITAYSSSGSITEGTGNFFLAAASLNLQAATGITLPQTQVATLTALNTGNTGSISVTQVTQTGYDGSLTVLQALQQSTSSNGNISISTAGNPAASPVTSGGSLTVASSANGGSGVVTNGHGNISLTAQGTGSTLTVSDNVTTTNGTVALTAPGLVTIGALTGSTGGAVTATSSAGSILVNANVNVQAAGGLLTLSAFGDITMTAGSILSSLGNGNITLTAGGNDVLATLKAGGLMTITATAGAITSAMQESTSAAQLNLAGSGSSATALLSAATGIGTRGHDIQTQLSELTLSNSTSGDVFIDQTQLADLQLGVFGSGIAAVTLGGSTGTASIVTTDGAITINTAVSSTSSVGNLLIEAAKLSSGTTDVNVNANVTSAHGSIEIESARNVVVGTGSAVTITATDANQTVYLQAASNVTFFATSLVDASGNVWVDATSGTVTLGEIKSDNATAAIDAGNTIADAQTSAGQTTANVTAANVRMTSGSGIGTSANDVVISGLTTAGNVTFAGTSTAAATTAGIFVKSLSDMTVGSVAAASVNATGPATPTSVGDAGALNSVAVSGASNLVLMSQGALTVANAIGLAGPVTINSTVVSTNLLLQAATQLNIDAAIGNIGSGFTTYAGNMSLTGASGVTIGVTNSPVAISSLGGTLDVESGAGSVQMSASSLLSAGSGAIRVLAAQNVGLAEASTTGKVAVTATAGSITDTNGNATGTAGVVNVQAAQVRLAAGTNIGSSADELQVHVPTLSAASAGGSVYVLDTVGETVGSVTVTVNQVGTSGATTTVTDAAQSGVTTGGSGNGNVVLQDSAGTFTIASAVSANGSGNVLLQASAGPLAVNAGVSSGSGNVSLSSGNSVAIGSGGAPQTVSTGGSGSIDVAATTGLAMAANSQVNAGSGAIRLSGTSIALARVSTTGNVSLLATGASGTIADSNGNTDAAIGTTNVTAAGLRLSAGGAVGTSADALELHVATIAASSATGGVFLLDEQTGAVGSVAATVNRVDASGAAAAVNDTALAGLATLANGSIVLQTTVGDLTVNSVVNANGSTAGSGNVLLQSELGALVLNANVDGSGSSTGNGTGSLSLYGATGVNVANNVAAMTGSGTIDVESGAAVTMGTGSALQNGNANIGVVAATSIVVGTVQSNVAVALTANGGSITDAYANPASVVENIIASAARLQAGNGVGQSTDALRTQLTNVTASAGAGGVYLVSDQAETVSHATVLVNKVAQDGTAGTTLNQLQQNGVNTSAAGNVVLQATAGNITLSPGTGGQAAVTASGGGNVLVQTLAGAVNVNASVYSDAGGTGSGNVTVLGAGGVNLALVASGATLGTGTGAIDVESSGGNIAMAATALVADANGAIRMAAQNIALGEVVAGGNVSLTASGAITDADGNTTAGASAVIDVQANALRLNAGTGVGTPTDALRTQVGTLSATATVGGAYVINDQALTIGSVATTVSRVGLDGTTTPLTDAAQTGFNAGATGNLVVDTTTGNLTLANAVNAAGTGNVLVQAKGGTVQADANVQSVSGAVSLLGSAGVTINPVQVSSAGTLDVESSAGSVMMIVGSVLSSGSDIRVKALTDIGLSHLVTPLDVALTATNGNIVDDDGNTDAVAGVQDVQSNGLRLFAGNRIGLGTDALQVQVNTISENGGQNGAFVIADQSIIVGTVSASVSQVGLDGNPTTVSDAAQAGLVSRNGGDLVLQASAGDVTLTSASPAIAAVNASTGGDILVQSVAGAVNANANVVVAGGSGAGNIDVLGATGVNIGAPGVVVTVGTGAGTVDVESSAGAVAMSAHSVLASGSRDVRVVAATNIAVGTIESGDNVSLAAGGSVFDANGNANGQGGTILNVQADGLRLSAGLGVGTGTDALQVQIDTLAASVGNHGLFLVDDQALGVGSVGASVDLVGVSGVVSSGIDAALTGVVATTGGDVVLRASSGDLDVDAAVVTGGNANVLLQSVSGAVDLAANVNLVGSSGATGSISVIGAAGVSVAAGVGVLDSNLGAASLDVESSNGSVQMATGSTLSATSVRVIAAQDIGLAQVLSPGNVALTATAGTISNATQPGYNVLATGLYLSAGTAAGTGANALRTQVATLSAAVGNGGMDVVNDQGFATNSVSTTINQVGLDGNTTGVTTATVADAIASSGAVTLEASTGDIALDSASAAVAAINANGSGNVLVEAITGSIAVNANVLDGSVNTAGGISLLADHSVTIGASAPVGIVDGAGAMDIEAFNGDVTMGATSALQASVGTVRVVAEGSVALGIVQATGNTLVQAVTGTLEAQSGITVGAGTQAGTLTLHAAQDLDVDAGVVVSDGAGAVAITSDLGNVNLATSSTLQSASGTVSVVAAQSVAAGTVNATGNTLIQAQGGTLTLNNSVTDGTGAQAGTLTLLATGDIVAAAGVVLHDGAGRIDVASSAGNVTLAATSTLSSDGGTVNVNAAQSVALGQLLANANTRVEAQAGSIAVNNTLQVGSGASAGDLSLLALGEVDIAAGMAVSSGAGSIDIESRAGSVDATFGSAVQSVSGAVHIAAAQDIEFARIATAGNVGLTAIAGSIDGLSGAVDVAADGLLLAAGDGVHLGVQVDTVTASSGGGGVTLVSDQSVIVGTVSVSSNQVSTGGTTSPITDGAQSGIVSASNGSISLQATSGDITLTPAGGNAIAANGTGSVLVDALDAAGNVNAFAGIASGTGSIDVEAGDNITLYTANSAAAQLVTALPGLVTVHAINGTVYSGGATAPGQTVNFNTDQLTLQAPLTGTDNQLNIGPSTVASNPDAVVVGGPAAGAGSLYLSQQQIGLIQTGFKDVDIGSTIPGQVVSLVGQDASGNASTNVFVNPLTLTASGAGGTVAISGGLQSTSLDIEGSRTGTTLAAAGVSTSGAIVVDDNVIVTGATSLTSGTGGAAGLTVNGTITGTGANSLAMSANGGNIVVTGAVSGLGALTVTNAASLTFQSTLDVTGNVVINTTGAVDFVGGVTIAAGGTLTINGASSVTFASTADFTQAGNVKISTTVLNFAGGAGSVHGVGNLTLQGPTAGAPIHLGSNVVAGSLNINAQDVSAIASGFQQVVIGTVDPSTGHASGTAGAVDIDGSMSLAAFASPLAIYASTITVDAGGTGVHVGGPLTLDAVGQIQIGSNVTTTVAANVSLTSATSTIQMTAQTAIATLGGNVTVTTGHSSNATLSVIDTRATGSDVGAVVAIDVQNGRVIDANADSSVNVYGAAVSMKGYGLTDTPGSSQNSVLKVRAPVVYVASPTGDVVADAGQDGRTNYNALDHGTLYEELISVGSTTRVTLPGDAVAGGGSEAPTAGALDVSLIHAAAADAFMSRLMSATIASADADGVSLGGVSADSAEPSGYVLGSLSGHPSVSGAGIYGDGAFDWWTESLEV